jgi:hypothetical protein
MCIRTNQSEEIVNLQAATVTWYENSPIPDHDTPSSLEKKNTRLEVIQKGIRSVTEKELLKPKKKVSKGIYFFGAYPIPLQMLKTHLHCLVRLKMLLDHPLSCKSYKADGSLKGPRLRRYLKRLAVWRDHAKSIFEAEWSLNMIRSSQIAPHLSAWEQLHGAYDFNATPAAPPGMLVAVHEVAPIRESWGPHAVRGFYVGPAFKHYRCYTCWIPSTQKTRISDCIEWFPRGITTPSATPLKEVAAAAKDLGSTVSSRSRPHTPCLFVHQTRDIKFTLIVDDFGVKYSDKKDVEFLISILEPVYDLHIDWSGSKYLGISLDWDYTSAICNVSRSLPGYVAKGLQALDFVPSTKPVHSPGGFVRPQYGATTQLTDIDTSPPVDDGARKGIQKALGIFNWYLRVTDPTFMVCSEQAHATKQTVDSVEYALNYLYNYPDAHLVFYASDMTLHGE